MTQIINPTDPVNPIRRGSSARMMDSKVKGATWAIKQGFAIFPLVHDAKEPAIKDWPRRASSRASEMRRWFQKDHNYDWGIEPNKSGLVFIDVDRKPGKRGGETFLNLDLEHQWPDTLTSQTTTGGLHLIYRRPAGRRHIVRQNALGPHIDLPPYIVCPGSRIGGKLYRIIRNVPIALAPPFIYDVMGDMSADRQHVAQEPVIELDLQHNIEWAINYLLCDAPQSIQGQNGDKALLDVFAQLKDHGISIERAIDLVDEHYNVEGKCDPIWLIGEGDDRDRLDVKATNAYGYLTENAPGSKTAEAEFGPVSPAELEELRERRKRDRQRDIQRGNDGVIAYRAELQRRHNPKIRVHRRGKCHE